MPKRRGNQTDPQSNKYLSITALTTLAAAVVLIVAIIISPKVHEILAPSSQPSTTLPLLRRVLGGRYYNLTRGLFTNKLTTTTTTTTTTTSNMTTTTAKIGRTPVYFVSHGGPTTMYDKEHPVYPQLQAIGREITEKIKPKAIVVISAHWQAQAPNTIEVNVSEEEPLLYDYYGFPKHYYFQKVSYRGSAQVAHRVIDLLGQAGIKTEETERGLDHGVFVPFIVMFPPENPIHVPIVQASLFEDDTDAEAHIKFGRALEKLRDENILIIVSGMSVHNLRHFGMLRMAGGPTMPYAVSFDAALKEAVETAPGEERDKNMIALLKRVDARQAHPTFEHLIPVHVGVGAAGQDAGKQLWTMSEMSMAWAQFRFGEVSA